VGTGRRITGIRSKPLDIGVDGYAVRLRCTTVLDALDALDAAGVQRTNPTRTCGEVPLERIIYARLFCGD
jgi:hypothetical protein